MREKVCIIHDSMRREEKEPGQSVTLWKNERRRSQQKKTLLQVKDILMAQLQSGKTHYWIA